MGALITIILSTAMLGAIVFMMITFGYPYIFGFATAIILAQVAHKAKYGEFWVDS